MKLIIIIIKILTIITIMKLIIIIKVMAITTIIIIKSIMIILITCYYMNNHNENDYDFRFSRLHYLSHFFFAISCAS